MAIDPVTLGILLKGGSQMIKSGSRLLSPKFGRTAYGRQLKYAGKEGMLSPGAEKTILNKVGNVASRQADATTNKYMGSFINRGIQDSVSVKRGLREAENDVRRTVSDTAKGMYVDEERAKRQAKLDYARAVDQDKAERRQAGIGMVTAGLDTVSGISGARAQQAEKLAMDQKADATASSQSYTDAVNKYGIENVRSYMTPSGQKRYTGGLDPSSPGGTVKSIAQLESDAKSIDGNRQKAMEFIAQGTTDAERQKLYEIAKQLYPDLFI
tara:strand:+ start:55 stop:861 length:807 start_codon:yes stop_codon:yes gene_type:complete